MTDPRYIPPAERERFHNEVMAGDPAGDYYERLRRHAAFMDERDAMQRDLIRRLADWVEQISEDGVLPRAGTWTAANDLLAEARGIEATP